jgi:hypothetical protein
MIMGLNVTGTRPRLLNSYKFILNFRGSTITRERGFARIDMVTLFSRKQ